MTLSASERLANLARSDKWVISNAQRLIFAPTHPRYLDKPGLWDEVHYYNHPIRPVGTVSLVDGAGNEVFLRLKESTWQPDRWIRTFTDASETQRIVETGRMSEDGRIELSYAIEAKAPYCHAVFWTALGNGPARSRDSGAATTTFTSFTHQKDSFSCFLESSFETLHQPALHLEASWKIASTAPFQAISAHSQGRSPEPRFDQTPFFDRFERLVESFGELEAKQHTRSQLENPDGILYAGFHIALDKPTVQCTIAFGITCSDLPAPIDAGLGPNWKHFYASCPSFKSDNAFFTAYFDYRLFGLRMNALPGGAPCIPFPAVCEGPGYFRAPITYSAQCHILESRWLPSCDIAQGSLLNFIANQQEDGRYIGYLGPVSLPGEFFYHANWGRILELDHLHPDPSFLRKAKDSLTLYVAFFNSNRDPEGSGLYDILNHYETGQEYMHRYVAVEKSADEKHWGDVFRLKGIDVSVYMYQIMQTLSEISEKLGETEEAETWRLASQKTGNAILEKMWDPEEEMFFDINPQDGRRTGVKAAVCFYPYLTELVEKSHLNGLKRHLLNPEEFWTPFPVPSSSVDDAFYNPDGEWKGERKNCPWNGRVWPMTNSHIAEALAVSALRFDDQELRERTALFITKYIEMMFFQHDAGRPNSFEHYHPETGKPSVFRGVDDYQHSWILDLIVQFICGVRPSSTHLTIDPFPFDVSMFDLSNINFRGNQLSVKRQNDQFSVSVNQGVEHTSQLGQPILIPFDTLVPTS
jgi:hypothetical protein